MKKLLIITAFLGFSFILNAKQIDLSKATITAQNFVAKTPSLNRVSGSTNELSLVKTEKILVNNQSLNSFFIFNLISGGFIIISADDLVTPILAYSNTTSFDKNEIPTSVEFYFKEVNEGIKEAILKNQTSQQAANEWNYYATLNVLKGGNGATNTAAGVGPYVTTTWNQSGGYQKFCPSYTGCVGTAFAQILKYYNYPAMGMGFKSYTNDFYGTQAANFGATTYNWADMPNQLTSSTPTNKIDAVATLMYHAGVSVDMNYTPSQSSAYATKVVDALKKTFGYANSVSILSRASYTLQSWTAKIKSELDASRIVMHTGFCPNPVAGHAFVVDGYDANGLYHINWGWGGHLDGYFQLNSLNTGVYTWNQNQQLIVGITPGSTANYTLTLDAAITAPVNIKIGQTTTVTSKIKNTGTASASGSFMAALFNEKNELVTTLQTLSSKTVAPGASLTLTFSKYNINVLPGNYKLGIYFAPNGVATSWKLVGSGSYANPIAVKAATTNDLVINSAYTCYPSANFFQNDSFAVSLNIKNTASTAFNGDIKASVYSASGVLRKDIEIKTATTISAGNVSSFVFKLSTLNLTAGTYYIAIQSKAGATASYIYLNAATSFSPTQAIIIKKKATSNKEVFLDENNNIVEEDNVITIYPNPTAFELNINTNNSAAKTIMMMDLNGRIVKQIEATQEMITTITVSDLSNGIYFISVIQDNKQKTYKIIKQ